MRLIEVFPRQWIASEINMESERARSSSRKGLNNVDGPVNRDRICQPGAIEYRLAIDENGHVLSQTALIIEHIPAGHGIAFEISVQHIPERSALNGHGRTRNVPLNVLRKSNLRHSGSIDLVVTRVGSKANIQPRRDKSKTGLSQASASRRTNEAFEATPHRLAGKPR
jgi:hypothetical protein